MSAEAAAASTAAPVASGLDAYEVVCPIGRGSFGTVSKIVRRADGRVLVWKELCYGGALGCGLCVQFSLDTGSTAMRFF